MRTRADCRGARRVALLEVEALRELAEESRECNSA